MALRHITRQAVQQAIQEFDRVGRKKFLKKMASVLHRPTG